MGIIIYLFFVALHFAVVALDVVLLFVVVRLICGRRQTWKPLMAFDRAGRPLVDHVQDTVGRWWNRVHPARHLTTRETLYLAVAVICAARFVICLVWALAT